MPTALRAAAARRRPRCPSASACAGRRSCSACTSRSTRWARSPSRSGASSTPTRATSRDESLDGQRVVVGGIVTGMRTVITKRQETMAIATIEDLQGSIEVVVFPRLYETTRADLARRRDPARRRPGRPQGRGGLAAGRPRDRLGRRRGQGSGGLRPRGRGRGPRTRRTAPAARGGRPGRPAGGRRSDRARSGARRRVRPTRGRRRSAAGRAAPDRAGRTGPDLSRRRPAGAAATSDDEPAVPDEARARIVADATADAPVDAGPDTVLHVRFERRAGPDRLVSAMEQFKALLRDRPGSTRVVIHVPAPGGGAALADGAAPRRGLRHRARRRGPAAARRGPRRPAPRQRLTPRLRRGDDLDDHGRPRAVALARDGAGLDVGRAARRRPRWSRRRTRSRPGRATSCSPR